MRFTRFGFSVPAGVDRRTAVAMRRLLDQITPSHSITSRRHSIATIIRGELDEEIERVVRAYCVELDADFLPDFRLSRVWLRSPTGHAPPDQKLHAVAAANLRAGQWREVLKRVVRQAKEREITSRSAQLGRFSQTLDSVIELIDVLSSLKPAHTHEGGQHGKRVSLKVISQQRYCDLCWRPTMFSIAREPRDADDRRLGASRRFCAEHNPQSLTSSYRRDVARKEGFASEVKLLNDNWSMIRDSQGPVALFEDVHEPSGYQVHLAPVTPDRQDIRRAAYALIHVKLRGSGSQCWILRKMGLSTRQIAEKIRLTQRAVRTALAAFETKLVYADRIRSGFDEYA